MNLDIIDKSLWRYEYSDGKLANTLYKSKPRKINNQRIIKYKKCYRLKYTFADIEPYWKTDYIRNYEICNIFNINSSSMFYPGLLVYDSFNCYIKHDFKDKTEVKTIYFITDNIENEYDNSLNASDIKQSNEKANINFINNVMKDGINSVLDKYGMLLDNNGIKFKDYKSMKSFIINCLNDSVFKELKEIGIIASFNKQIQNVNPQKILVKIKDLKIDLEKDNNK